MPKVVLQYYHPARVALMQEVKEHPELVDALLESFGPITEENFPDYLGGISAYVGIEVDGYYTQEEIHRMCTILYSALQEKRKVIIH